VEIIDTGQWYTFCTAKVATLAVPTRVSLFVEGDRNQELLQSVQVVTDCCPPVGNDEIITLQSFDYRRVYQNSVTQKESLRSGISLLRDLSL